jgi:hypothetical protein
LIFDDKEEQSEEDVKGKTTHESRHHEKGVGLSLLSAT